MSDIHVGKPAYTLFIWISVSPRAAYWVEKSVVEPMAITKPSGDVRRCVFRYSSSSIGILNGIWHASCSNSSSWLLSVPAACDHGRRKIGESQVKCRYLQKQQKLVPIEKPQFSQLIFYFSILLNLFVYLIQINFFQNTFDVSSVHCDQCLIPYSQVPNQFNCWRFFHLLPMATSAAGRSFTNKIENRHSFRKICHLWR